VNHDFDEIKYISSCYEAERKLHGNKKGLRAVRTNVKQSGLGIADLSDRGAPVTSPNRAVSLSADTMASEWSRVLATLRLKREERPFQQLIGHMAS